jgi:hypothetical protein
VGSALATLLTITILLAIGFLFFLFAYALIRFLRFVWTRLPSSVLSVQASNFDKLLGVIIALIFTPSLLKYGWTTVGRLFEFAASVIRKVADPAVTGLASCVAKRETCLSDVSQKSAALLGDTALGLTRALSFAEFPVTDFVFFLLLAIVFTQIVGFIIRAIEVGRLELLIETGKKWLPQHVIERIVFIMLIVTAFYLGLSALVAIPLFQDKSRPQNLTVETLEKLLDSNVTKGDAFERSFPADLPTIREPTPVAPQDGQQLQGNRVGLQYLSQLQRMNSTSLRELQTGWTSIRQSVLNEQFKLRDQARNAFASAFEVGIGRKQISEYYYDLYNWHQVAVGRMMVALRICYANTTEFVTRAAHFIDSVRLDAASDDSRTPRAFYSEEAARRWSDSYDAAATSCRLGADTSPGEIPHRKSFAQSLGTVGSWSGWLLETEQMPVVIIVGLVGFSLLGATASRAIRAPDGLKAALTLDDLIIVVASGTTGAMVVFLASYGGLAIIGGNNGDPNPYVVFAACLVAAVYSEDVWTWARRRLSPSTPNDRRRARAQEKITDNHEQAQ